MLENNNSRFYSGKSSFWSTVRHTGLPVNTDASFLLTLIRDISIHRRGFFSAIMQIFRQIGVRGFFGVASF